MYESAEFIETNTHIAQLLLAVGLNGQEVANVRGFARLEIADADFQKKFIGGCVSAYRVRHTVYDKINLNISPQVGERLFW
jgi:hypothetical protein